ncbi:hypothetical protein FRACYDRAFT_270984 [Fragilariopsis cylindrus CCMP1102]|uniref:Uncharacterized protein n=1 Tax=Fragilariopsis cylindrus CCMP1102 TaxID=635003 RepID=A0A1E7EY72_9STRA|nr:hypothetical protein FRACYDRAFT_270984 [Fragilariopsis cylindrus CCMP1102]|eukprot:OEU10769.1 hypothetical protein FRACYDRAFT_270984 [Fragilariopsis cylindrus CCMP1102]
MASATCSKELMKVLTTPSKIASALDWKKQIGGSIATIDFHATRIGLTISHHPDNSITNDEVSSSSSGYYSIPMFTKGKQKIPDSSRQQLSELVQDNKVCGFVISWPLQKDTGLMGASCGRTLFAIEELLQHQSSQSQVQSQSHQSEEKQNSTNSNSSVFTVNRPICLWDSIHEEQPKADIFGRSSVYSRTSTKKEHCASKEQYHQDESIVATKVWEDFVKTNWPDIYATNEYQQQHSMATKSSSSSSSLFNNNIESSSSTSTPSQEEEEQQPRKTLAMVA